MKGDYHTSRDVNSAWLAKYAHLFADPHGPLAREIAPNRDPLTVWPDEPKPSRLRRLVARMREVVSNLW